MLRQVAEGAFVHTSDFIESHAVVVQGRDGVLLIDPGIQGSEMARLASDLSDAGHSVVAGFSTHPHWDHVLWHPGLGEAPRYGTARCAAAIGAFLSDPTWEDDIAEELPPEVAGDVPLDLLGRLTALPADATRLPWDGPRVRIVEHQAHAPGHAALLIEKLGVLVAGDMLSDFLVPMLDLAAADPIEDYLAALQLLDGVARDVDVFIPGHGSIADRVELRARIDRDRAYVHRLRDGGVSDDPRIGSSAKAGWEWVTDVHEGQRQGLARRGERPEVSI